MSVVIRPAARIWAFLMLLGAIALFQPALAQSTNIIDTNAKLHVVVANEDTLTGDYTVDSDGNITMLYINQVHVQGLTPAQVAAAIRGTAASGNKKATGLFQFYVNPQVVVTIVDVGGIGVEVTGLVGAARHYVVRSDAHLNDVLQQAVPALNADLSKIEITLGSNGTKEMVDYRSYLDAKNDAGNPPLHDGDIVNVGSKEPLPIYINIQGQVVKPGRFPVPASTTAYSAIQAAGGLTVSANLAEIVIKHFGTDPTDAIPFKYDLAGQSPTDTTVNPILQDGDTIIVPAAPISAVYTITGPGVRNPAEYPLPDGRAISLATAIGKAGGLTDRAKIKEVSIIRTDPVTRKTQTIKLNAGDPNVQGTYLVQPGDNITIDQGSPGKSIDPLSGIGIVLAVLGIFRH